MHRITLFEIIHLRDRKRVTTGKICPEKQKVSNYVSANRNPIVSDRTGKKNKNILEPVKKNRKFITLVKMKRFWPDPVKTQKKKFLNGLFKKTLV